jgi:predicted PurR-regulated permease PerM
MRATAASRHSANPHEPGKPPKPETAEKREMPADDQTPEPVARVPVDVRSAALTAVALLALVLVLQYAQAMLIPIVIGILISYALEPPVAGLTRLRIPRPIAAAIVLIAAVGASGRLVYSLRGEAAAIIEQLPSAARRLRQTLESGHPRDSAIQQVQKAANELEKAASAAAPPPAEAAGVQRVQVEDAPFNVGDYLVWGSISLATAVGQMILVLFLVFFLLASGDLYRRKLVKIAGPSFTKKKITVQILSEIDRQIETFLAVQAFTSIVVAVVTWLAFRWLGVQQAAVWGIVAGVMNSIPYFGPVVVTGGTAIIAFLQFGTIHMALIVSGVSLVITSLEGMLLTPWLTSRAARMNAVAIFVGLLFWGWVWNVWGLLLAVPMLMVIKAICDHVDDFKNVGEMIGE